MIRLPAFIFEYSSLMKRLIPPAPDSGVPHRDRHKRHPW